MSTTLLSTPAPAAATPLAAAAPPRYTEEEQRWIWLQNSIDPTQHLPLYINSAFYPSNTSVHILPAIDEAFNAGLMTGTGVPTNFTFVNLPHSSVAMHCQRLYYQNGLAYGIRQRLAATASTPTTAAAPTPPRDRAPKLNPPKTFNSSRSEYKSFIMQLNLIFNSEQTDIWVITLTMPRLHMLPLSLQSRLRNGFNHMLMKPLALSHFPPRPNLLPLFVLLLRTLIVIRPLIPKLAA